ncbi:hypothetical protein EYM_03145 [Ignicoccus islandicus DSM 13165]|uniref:ArsR family transcriptional regulator n=1 Tax=Ignicoccus islandicus DSM 13165 TaxID=940295 RepID=A0A0U3FKL0_9CREN|nr:hypothetical protein [Ignicoccus islandicus]ALU12390.1 hypothetical protein EYM_03145 [Ignicoccus islandicus DSM 13165]
MAIMLNALGHPARLALALYLLRSKKGVVWEALRNALKENGLETDFDKLNYHLSILIKSGVVTKVKVEEGIWVYKLSRDARALVRTIRNKVLLKNSSSISGNEGSRSAEGTDRGKIHIERRSIRDTRKEMEGIGTRGL